MAFAVLVEGPVTRADPPAGGAPGPAVEAAPAALDLIPLARAAAPSLRREPPADAPTQALNTVVVTGTRTAYALRKSPVNVQVVDAQTIRDSGARDVAELLEREGGITVIPAAGRGVGIEIQGLSSQQVLILVDGRRSIGRINGAIDLSRFRLDEIDHIEIVKGPTSALYGADALGGVVNLITRRGGADEGGTVQARGDLGGNADATGRYGFGRGRVQGRLSGGYSHLANYDLDAQTPGKDGIDADEGHASGRLDSRLAPGVELGAYANYSLTDTARQDANGTARYNTTKRIEDLRTGLSPRLRLGSTTDLILDGAYNRYDDQYLQQLRDSRSAPDYERTVDQLGAGSVQLDQRWGIQRLTLGGEVQYETLHADRLSQDGVRDRQAVYLQDDLGLFGRRLVLLPGLRYDRDSQYGEQRSPKLAARLDLTRHWALRAGAGRAFRAPDFKELYLRFDNPAIGYRVVGNPNLSPERSSGYNLGTVWYLSARSSLTLDAYRNRVTDLIDIVQTALGPPTIYSYRNVRSARITGIDLQARWRLWTPLEVQAGYGWLDAEDLDQRVQLSGRARNRANAALRWERADYALQARGVWIGKRVFQVDLNSGGPPTGAGTADAYTLLDLRAELKTFAPLTAALGIKNLLDAGDRRFLPIQPRTAYLELTWSFR